MSFAIPIVKSCTLLPLMRAIFYPSLSGPHRMGSTCGKLNNPRDFDFNMSLLETCNSNPVTSVTAFIVTWVSNLHVLFATEDKGVPCGGMFRRFNRQCHLPRRLPRIFLQHFWVIDNNIVTVTDDRALLNCDEMDNVISTRDEFCGNLTVVEATLMEAFIDFIEREALNFTINDPFQCSCSDDDGSSSENVTVACCSL